MSIRIFALAVVALTAIAGLAHAEDAFTLKTQVYADSNDTVVVSPLVALSRDAWTGGTLSAHYVADVISSASIDVTSNASRRMADFRSEVSASLVQRVRASTISAGYTYSVEHDYESHGAELGFQQDLFQRNTTLSLGYGFSHNDVGRAGDRSFHRTLDVQGASISVAQTLGTKMVGSLGYTFSWLDGYQASPYRYVRIAGAQTDWKVPETLPLQRARHSIVASWRRHLFRDSSLHLDYRLYLDSWGIAAHTVQLGYFVSFGDVTLRIRERVYYQDGASFFRTSYSADDLPSFVTADKELSTLWSSITGLKVDWRLPVARRALALEAKADFFYIGYINYALLSSRVGADLALGLSVIY